MRRTARFISFMIAGLTFWAVIVTDIIYSPRNFDVLGAVILALVLAWIIGDETWKALRKAWPKKKEPPPEGEGSRERCQR